MRLSFSLSAAVVAAAASSSLAFSFKDFYVAVDGRQDVSGTTGYYVNHNSPNFGRLTVAWAHAFPTGYSPLDASNNHYHRIGAWVFPPAPTGWTTPLPGNQTPPAPVLFNNNVPERGTSPVQTNFLRVASGTGVFSSRLVVVDQPDASVANHSYYDNLTFASIHQMEADTLADPVVAANSTRLPDGTFQWSTSTLPAASRASTSVGWMYTSGAYRPVGAGNVLENRNVSRFTRHFDDAQVALQLVSRDGALEIATTAGTPILVNAGDTQLLGSGRTWEFTPVFNIDPNLVTDGQILQATFRLVDLRTSNALGSSGDFTFWVQVPEPTTLGLLAGAGMLALRRTRRV